MSDVKSLRVLVLEDQTNMRALIYQMLVRIGVASVVEAGDVKEALAVLRAEPQNIDLVLCDWNLPGDSGLDFMRQVRGFRPSVRFVMVTGRVDRESVLAAKQAGAAGYIVKPFSLSKLQQTLESVMAAP